MIKIANAQLWVHDQDEALAFYTEKVGMEVRADVTLPEMGDFRWLTVGPAGQEDVAIVLMAIPGPPVMDEETAEQVRELMAKGFAGTVFLTTDDCQASYEELKARGVEFTEAPEERPYGIDSGFRDPSGNSIRLTQVQPAGRGLRPRTEYGRSWARTSDLRLVEAALSQLSYAPGVPESSSGARADARSRAAPQVRRCKCRCKLCNFSATRCFYSQRPIKA